MTLATLKERIEPYLSVRVFGLTLSGLLGITILTVIGLALSSRNQDIETSVMLPLASHDAPVPQGDEHAGTAEAPHDVTPSPLNPADIAVTEPTPDGHATTPVDPTLPVTTQTTATDPVAATPIAPVVPAVPEKKVKPPIEDAVAGLHESTPFGMVPVVRKNDNLTAFKAYQTEFVPLADTRAIISLVMVDFGLSQSTSEKAIVNLPEPVTFSLSPYSRDAQKMTTSARQGGHEVWLNVPIQHGGFGIDDSGSLSILVNAGIDQNKSRLLTSLGKATGYAGVIDLDTPAFSDAAADLENIYSAIAERGLALAQGNPKDTVTGAFAASHKAPFIQNDVWIDKSVSPQAVAEELEKLKQLALNGNIAVGFFHPYPAVIAAIKDWSLQLGKDKIQLAPLSAAINQKTAAP